MPVQRPNQTYQFKMSHRSMTLTGLTLAIPLKLDRAGFQYHPQVIIENTLCHGSKVVSGPNAAGYIAPAGQTNCCGAQTIYINHNDYSAYGQPSDYRPYSTLTLLYALQVAPKGVNIIITPSERSYQLPKEAKDLLEKHFKVDFVSTGDHVSFLNLVPLNDNSIEDFSKEVL